MEWDKILSFCDFPTLAACARVNKDWLELSRRYLYQYVPDDEWSSSREGMLISLSQNPSLCSYVRSLGLAGFDVTFPDDDLSVIDTPMLRRRAQTTLEVRETLAMEWLSRVSHVCHVTLRETSDGWWITPRVLKALPKTIKSLSLHVHVHQDRPIFEERPFPSCPLLSSITIHTGGSSLHIQSLIWMTEWIQQYPIVQLSLKTTNSFVTFPIHQVPLLKTIPDAFFAHLTQLVIGLIHPDGVGQALWKRIIGLTLKQLNLLDLHCQCEHDISCLAPFLPDTLSAPRLSRLHIHVRTLEDVEAFRRFIPQCRLLEHLRILYLQEIWTYVFTSLIMFRYPYLKRLSLVKELLFTQDANDIHGQDAWLSCFSKLRSLQMNQLPLYPTIWAQLSHLNVLEVSECSFDTHILPQLLVHDHYLGNLVLHQLTAISLSDMNACLEDNRLGKLKVCRLSCRTNGLVDSWIELAKKTPKNAWPERLNVNMGFYTLDLKRSPHRLQQLNRQTNQWQDLF
jgi:hypothetical protein